MWSIALYLWLNKALTHIEKLTIYLLRISRQKNLDGSQKEQVPLLSISNEMSSKNMAQQGTENIHAQYDHSQHRVPASKFISGNWYCLSSPDASALHWTISETASRLTFGSGSDSMPRRMASGWAQNAFRCNTGRTIFWTDRARLRNSSTLRNKFLVPSLQVGWRFTVNHTGA